MLELKNIRKVFKAGTINENVLFEDFNFKVEKGDFISVIGSNGSGKTTMFNMISGTTAPDAGHILLEGKDITNEPEYIRSKKIGRVYQNPAIGTVAGMTVLENLCIAADKHARFGLKRLINKNSLEIMKEKVAELNMGLEDRLNIPVGLLSGGQRQALSLLMSTESTPDLLLLDEHTAALDPKIADTVMVLTDKIVKEKNVTAIMITHNLRYAVEYGNRLVMMHEGKVILDISGEEKKNASVDSLLDMFYKISIERGNSV